MSIVLDTGVLYAFLNADDPRHAEAVSLLGRVASGEFGSPIVSEHIVDELLSLVRFRRLPVEIERAARALLPMDGPSPVRIRIALLGAGGLAPTAQVYAKHRDRRLSFTDASHIVLMARLGVERLATFEKGFHGLVPTVP